jgi:hypothetical protein
MLSLTACKSDDETLASGNHPSNPYHVRDDGRKDYQNDTLNDGTVKVRATSGAPMPEFKYDNNQKSPKNLPTK